MLGTEIQAKPLVERGDDAGQRLQFLRRSVAATAVASCFAYTHGASPVHANPTGPAVKHGTATFQQSGGILQITNSPNAVIHWQTVFARMEFLRLRVSRFAG